MSLYKTLAFSALSDNSKLRATWGRKARGLNNETAQLPERVRKPSGFLSFIFALSKVDVFCFSLKAQLEGELDNAATYKLGPCMITI